MQQIWCALRRKSEHGIPEYYDTMNGEFIHEFYPDMLVENQHEYDEFIDELKKDKKEQIDNLTDEPFKYEIVKFEIKEAK